MCMIDCMVLKNRVAYYRKLVGMTQSDLGDTVGVSKNTISSIENGYESPNVALCLAIAHVLGVSVDKLFYLKFQLLPF